MWSSYKWVAWAMLALIAGVICFQVGLLASRPAAVVAAPGGFLAVLAIAVSSQRRRAFVGIAAAVSVLTLSVAVHHFTRWTFTIDNRSTRDAPYRLFTNNHLIHGVVPAQSVVWFNIHIFGDINPRFNVLTEFPEIHSGPFTEWGDIAEGWSVRHRVDGSSYTFIIDAPPEP